MALHEESVAVDDPVLRQEEKLALILGTERVRGLKGGDHRPLSDHTIKIPMSHGVDSLNVAAASAVAFWELGKDSPSRLRQQFGIGTTPLTKPFALFR